MVQQNIELGPCRVLVNETDVGPTLGPVRLSVKTVWRERRSDRHGATPVERIALGGEARASLRLAEKTLANLKRALPQATEGTGYLSLGSAPGFKAGSAAVSLRLHPEERSDAARDVVLHKAVAGGAVELDYGPGQGRAFEVEFVALLDPSRADGDRVMRLYQGD